MTRDEALKHFKVAIGRMVRHLERAGVLHKPKITAEIVSVTESDLTIRVTIPRHLVPDLIVLRPDDLVGVVSFDTQDLMAATDSASAEFPRKDSDVEEK